MCTVYYCPAAFNSTVEITIPRQIPTEISNVYCKFLLNAKDFIMTEVLARSAADFQKSE